MTADISRHSFRPEQRFTGVVHQQGRVGLDADANEAGDLAALALRETVADVICTHGTPDDGFRITNPTVDNDALDFDVAAGTFYLGGSRCETPGSTYRTQPDWLTFSLDDPGPSIPAAEDERTDLIYLSAWEQVVTAVEDAELLEQGLGGPDTTARQRMVCQVRVIEDVPDDCEDALDEAADRLFPDAQLVEGGEVVSDIRMTVGFTVLEPLEDLCRPSAQAGFLGARNEAFRVQVTTPGRFVWGRDNASPLYRVQVEDFEGDRRRIVFLAPPRDQHGWPLAGMTVELLRWGAQLANGEKVAEPAGLLLRVDNGFDPETSSLIVTPDVPQEWSDWFTTPEGQAAINPRDEPGAQAYFFLRVWTGGGDGGAVDNDMDAGNAVALGETGLTVTFSGGAGLPGDYWVIAARPNTPTLVTPWSLLDGAAPAGPHRYLAALALLAWEEGVPEVNDCRHRFRPLCQVGGCCTVTVGDGHNSVGDVESIQEAVDRLPAEGGEICIHPGEYEEHVVVEGRRNITFTGCGRRTRWHGVAGLAQALLTIRDSSGIVVRKLAMEGTAGECVVALGGAVSFAKRIRLADLLLEDLHLTASDVGAVAVFEIRGCTVRRCQVSLERMSEGLNENTTAGRAAALFLVGDQLTVEHCRIEAERGRGVIQRPSERQRLAAGGIHIGGGSDHVIIRDNVIAGGNGHGVTLGSVQYLPPEGGPVVTGNYTTAPAAPTLGGQANGFNYYGANFTVDAAGCIRSPGTPPVIVGDVPDAPPLHPESAGDVRLVWIQRNDISSMGYSGISAHVFAELGRPGQGFDDAIAVEQIEITENRIVNCMQNEIGEMSPLLRLLVGWGGIALSICTDATIRDNVIIANGSKSREPIAGIFLGLAEDVKVERNRIERNGRVASDGQAIGPGQRGGIVVGVATGGVSTLGEENDPSRNVDRPALVVTGNMVDAPSGRALRAITLGPCMVLGNRLTGAGRSAFASNLFESLMILGLGISVIRQQIFQSKSEIDLGDYLLLDRLADVLGGDVVNLMSLAVAEDLDLRSPSPVPGGAAGPVAAQRLRGGELMFNDNQVSLQRHSKELGSHLSAVLLLSADDVSFADNQAEVENDVTFVLTNCLVISASLRFCSNRLQERLNRAFLSAITWGMMNATTLNQTTHCILAVAPANGRVVRDNRTVLGLQNPRACDERDRVAQHASSAVARENGLATAPA